VGFRFLVPKAHSSQWGSVFGRVSNCVQWILFLGTVGKILALGFRFFFNGRVVFQWVLVSGTVGKFLTVGVPIFTTVGDLLKWAVVLAQWATFLLGPSFFFEMSALLFSFLMSALVSGFCLQF
jgi:hypothetical protein